MANVTAIDPELSEYSDEVLLEAVIQYTHQLHGMSRGPRRDDVRIMREAVKREILRRMK